ncbi:MAG: helix-turn-helix domain-containing protein [Flavobacteriaceae bacterium]|nr:helix-turn-helix domain-containing protein [Flavobacteriaceae bacterium]
MAVNIITTEDLMEFKIELLSNIKEILNTQTGMKMKKWLKSPAVRELLSISPGTLQNLRINGTLPYTKVGGVIYYDYEEIVTVFEQNRIHNKF